jgi:hypothetical protein
MTMRRALAVVVALIAVLVARPSFAADDAEGARTHFAAGVRLYDAHDYANALAEFQAAYAAKKIPAIKRNVALCLKGLQRYPEAIDALDEMLAEGGDSLKPDVRDGAKRAIAELTAMIASVRLRIVFNGKVAPPTLTVTVDDRIVPPDKLGAPIRLMPGDHVFTAHAQGYFDGQQKLHLIAGQPETLVELGMVAIEIAQRGRLTVQTNVSTSQIAIDGIPAGTGSWTGDVAAGTHKVDVTAQGFEPHSADATVQANTAESVSIDMSAPTSPKPDPYPTPAAPKKSYDWYISAGLGIYGETLTFGPVLDSAPGTRRGVGGGGLVVHVGRNSSPHFGFGVVAEIGGLATSAYGSNTNTLKTVTTKLTNWVLAPEIRLRTSGKVRGFAGLALGLSGQSVTADAAFDAPEGTDGERNPRTVTGSSVAGMGLLELGGQVELGRVFLEGSLFADVHGVGAATSNQSYNIPGQDGRFFGDSPTVRAGLRLLVGYAF